jgi:hypothetical protein
VRWDIPLFAERLVKRAQLLVLQGGFGPARSLREVLPVTVSDYFKGVDLLSGK